ncbi:MAG: hypothetical protein VW362_05925 [Candidatus Nanopelagicales bacterium]
MSPHRFNVVPAGRRSLKTETRKRKLVLRALAGGEYGAARFFFAAPTRDQAKRIAWDDLKQLTPEWALADISESDLSIRLRNGSVIQVHGMDRPERIEGSPWDGGVLDEYANMRPHVWSLHVRPALADRRGWCDLIGVPEGRNHYYDIAERARADMLELGDESDWGFFTWTSAEILPRDEIEAARRDLDELSFRQEYGASFVNFTGRAYYAFSDENKGRLHYVAAGDIAFCFDFNVSPGVAVVLQEQELPNGQVGTGVIGEVHIPQNSNTEAVCNKLIADWGDHDGRVFVYGDATGGARGTAKVEGSDWDIVRRMLFGHFGSDRVFMRVASSNPPERARVNAVNTRCCAGDGTRRLFVDPARAPNVARDLEGVRVLAGGSGEIDKKADPALSHLSDALGYYVHREYPITERVTRSASFKVV